MIVLELTIVFSAIAFGLGLLGMVVELVERLVERERD